MTDPLNESAGVTLAPSPDAALREALETLLAAAFVGDDFLTQNGIPMTATPGVRRAVHKARAALAAQPPADAGREALWAKFTGGEKLAYGCGYRDGRAAEALDAERLARAYNTVLHRSGDLAGHGVAMDRWADIAREYAAQPEEPTDD